MLSCYELVTLFICMSFEKITQKLVGKQFYPFPFHFKCGRILDRDRGKLDNWMTMHFFLSVDIKSRSRRVPKTTFSAYPAPSCSIKRREGNKVKYEVIRSIHHTHTNGKISGETIKKKRVKNNILKKKKSFWHRLGIILGLVLASF